MSKTKSATQSSSIASGEGNYVGPESLKAGFEKSAQIFASTAEFNKGNIEAYVESAKVAGEGLRTIGTEISMYSKKATEETVVATKAIMAAKSIHEAVELQASFAKMAFGAYVGHLKLLNELYVATMKETLAPVQSRVEEFGKIAQISTGAK